jgi:hypothetical protein
MANPENAAAAVTSISVPVNETLFGVVVVLAAATAVVFARLALRTDFLSRLSRHLRRWAPLYLVLGPPSVTYIIACGFFSSCYASQCFFPPDLAGLSREAVMASVAFRMFYVIEWACSAVGGFLFAWLVRWLRLPSFWYGVAAASMSLTAAYRTAACRIFGTDGLGFGSGPEILAVPMLADTIPVVLGVCGFCVAAKVLERLNAKHRDADS